MGTASCGAQALIPGADPAKPTTSSASNPEALPFPRSGRMRRQIAALISSGESFRFSALILGLVLLVSFAICAEVAVYVTVEAAFSLVSKIYHQAILPRHALDDEGATVSREELADPSPSRASTSGARRQPSRSTGQTLARGKTTLNCGSNPHGCN